MNKFQKALENLGKHRAYINEQISELQEMVRKLDTDAFNFYGLSDLQELVNRQSPTANEVVDAWDKLGFEVNIDYDNNLKINSVYREVDRKNISFNHVAFDDAVVLGSDVSNLTYAEIKAIDLTINYIKDRGYIVTGKQIGRAHV